MVVTEGTQPPPADTRGQQRSSMFLAAILQAGTEQTPVKVRNMSQNGAMIESAAPPSAGTGVVLIRGALSAPGMVIWSVANRFGVHFSSAISVKDWVAAPTTVQQQRVDDMVALVKAGRTDTPREESAELGLRTHEQLVDDLGAVVRLMQDLEADLASSRETLERHGMKLQNLDIAMQMLRAVAGELKPHGGTGQVSITRLYDLRIACAQALDKG